MLPRLSRRLRRRRQPADPVLREARRIAGRFASEGTVLRLYDQLRDGTDR